MFSVSTCAKCGKGMFKVVTKEPSGSNFKINFVQCSSCNTPIGALEFFNAGSLLEDQKKEIAKINSRLSNIENTLNQIAHVLNQRR